MDTAETKSRDPSSWGPRHVFMFFTILLGGLGFVYKFMRFAKTAIQGELLGFAVVPLIIYVLVSSGFACLLVWAVVGGQFRNVEACKVEVMQRELDANDPIPVPFDPAAVSTSGRLLMRSFALASAGLMAYLFFIMFAAPNAPGVPPGSATVAQLEVTK